MPQRQPTLRQADRVWPPDETERRLSCHFEKLHAAPCSAKRGRTEPRHFPSQQRSPTSRSPEQRLELFPLPIHSSQRENAARSIVLVARRHRTARTPS